MSVVESVFESVFERGWVSHNVSYFCFMVAITTW